MTDAQKSVIDPKCKYTVIRNKIYDVTEFAKVHPGGEHMMSLAVGRDSTVMFESYHIRETMAKHRLTQLPVLEGVTIEELAAKTEFNLILPPTNPVVPSATKGDGVAADGKSKQAVDTFLLPGDSEMYAVLRSRIREEVLKPRGKTYGRGGCVRDTLCVLVSFTAASAWFISNPTCYSAIVAGLCATWIGLAVQHTANHGALADWPRVGFWLGMTDDLIGGSSLVWRYHHCVSHHLYTNDVGLDMDVFSSFPFVRLDPRQERKSWHRLQFVYAWVLFLFFYLSIQIQEVGVMLEKGGPSINEVRLIGASRFEIAMFWVLKVVHFALFLGLPLWLHGNPMIFAYFWLFSAIGGFTLGLTFLVSHNLEQVKPEMEATGKEQKGISTGAADVNNVCGDWCKWQIETSASWGGAVGSFFTGGLNLQIEHHLFPGVAHNCYPEIAVIIKEECKKRGVRYVGFDTLPGIVWELAKFLYVMGKPDNTAASSTGPEAPLLK